MPSRVSFPEKCVQNISKKKVIKGNYLKNFRFSLNSPGWFLQAWSFLQKYKETIRR